MAMTKERMEEIISTLNGSRAKGSGTKAAVLVRDISQAFGALPSSLRAKPVTAVPTTAQFNDLQADVAAIHRCLHSLAEAMRDRGST